MPDAVDMPAPVRTTTKRAARHAAASSSTTPAAAPGFLGEANGGGTVHRPLSPVKSAVPEVRTPRACTSRQRPSSRSAHLGRSEEEEEVRAGLDGSARRL